MVYVNFERQIQLSDFLRRLRLVLGISKEKNTKEIKIVLFPRAVKASN